MALIHPFSQWPVVVESTDRSRTDRIDSAATDGRQYRLWDNQVHVGGGKTCTHERVSVLIFQKLEPTLKDVLK